MCDQLLRDICDGRQYQDHKLESHDGPNLHILAYFNEVEICNPLESKAKIHKLGKLLIILYKDFLY